MVVEYTKTEQLRDARFLMCDLSGAEIRDSDVSTMKIVDVWGSDFSISGDIQRIVVNDVDVTEYVNDELDRQHPARVAARDASTPDDYRAAWNLIESMWADTLGRARALPEDLLHERVDREWSFVETLRHLRFASDAWLGNAVLEEAEPFHRWGIPAGGTSATEAKAFGVALDEQPTLDEVLAVRNARMATMRRTVDTLDDAELDRVCGRKPGDPYPDQDYVVRRCLRVVLREEAEHHRYAARDLGKLEAGR